MKTKILFFLSIIFSISAISQELFTSDYIALTVPQHYDYTIWYVNDSLKQEVKMIKDLKNDNSLLRSFPNIVSNVTVYEINQDGEFSVLGVGISEKIKSIKSFTIFLKPKH